MDQLMHKLFNGVEMPVMCLGPGVIKQNEHIFNSDIVENLNDLWNEYKITKVISNAPLIGCNCFDTSSAYGKCEEVLGRALKSKAREEIFITTKISNLDQRNKKVKDALNESMIRLGVNYIDLYLMHWPQKGKYLETWKQMEELYDTGAIKAIGVCNFHIQHFEELFNVAAIKPMVHQFELHPLFTQFEMSKFCNEENIQIMAYTPTGRGDDRLKNNHFLQRAALRHHKSIIQVILRWHFQKGNIPIMRTNSIEHLKENMNIFDFLLSDKEMKRIDSININSRLRYDSNNCEFDRL